MSPLPNPESEFALHPVAADSPRPAAAALASLAEMLVAAGFPSPADGYLPRPLDFNELLVRRPATTFVVRVTGESMRDANVHDGDLIVIDRSVEPRDGDVVVACVEGDLCVKRLRRRGPDAAWLESANPDYPPIAVNLEAAFAVEGVVTWSLHRQRRAPGSNGHAPGHPLSPGAEV